MKLMLFKRLRNKLVFWPKPEVQEATKKKPPSLINIMKKPNESMRSLARKMIDPTFRICTEPLWWRIFLDNEQKLLLHADTKWFNSGNESLNGQCSLVQAADWWKNWSRTLKLKIFDDLLHLNGFCGWIEANIYDSPKLRSKNWKSL